jgi:hypothetical protein
MSTEDRPADEKDKDKEKKDQHGFGDDPPIMVGGGGSTLVWMKTDKTTQITLANVDPDAPRPMQPNDYLIFEVDVNVTKAHVKKHKNDNGSPHTGLDPKTHRTRFDE